MEGMGGMSGGGGGVPWNQIIGGVAGGTAGVAANDRARRPLYVDRRLAPTVTDRFSQAGITGSQRAEFLQPLMTALLGKLYATMGAGPVPTVSGLRPLGNEAALGPDSGLSPMDPKSRARTFAEGGKPRKGSGRGVDDGSKRSGAKGKMPDDRGARDPTVVTAARHYQSAYDPRTAQQRRLGNYARKG